MSPPRTLVKRMAAVTKEHVREALRRIPGPAGGGDIVSLGLVSDIVVSDGKVILSVSVPAERARELEPLRQAAERAVLAVPGVQQAMVALTAERAAGRAGQPPRTEPTGEGAHAHAHAAAAPPKAGVPGVDSIIAVASGKGGVGKSTVAVNLALGLRLLDLKVGILDADIYGPSMPRLLGLRGRPEAIGVRTLKPMERYGLKVMSIGFMIEEETPMIWRGPMVQSALVQMLREVAWGTLDVLVVDMPPGTGDVQLTMAQQVPLAGAVIVSTPQDLALIDARKGLNMFRRVDVPVLGIVENMSYFVCPHCGERTDIFGHGGAAHEAANIGVPFLGAVPLHAQIRALSDAGTPVVAAEPDSGHAAAFRAIAAHVWQQVQTERTTSRQPPHIIME
jgi:ATP-binding protein involved in chromosome partitioning